ncbi:MAG: alpha/beta fold hydrolase [Pirellulales bacterium]
MKQFAYVALLSGLLLAGRAYSTETHIGRPELQGDIVNLRTASDVHFGIWGTKVRYPAPTLLVFSSTIEESLGVPYYRQCGNALAQQGYLCVSLDLPGHGLKQRADEPEGLAAWRFRSDQGEDFIGPFNRRVHDVLDYLIEGSYTDPQRIAACGTSRGGYLALQVTAAEPRIRATAAFAPVTNLSKIREFHSATYRDRMKDLSLYAKAENLTGRALWLVIGDRDDRVGTDDTIAFARRVTVLSLAQSKPADVTLIVQPEPQGHTTPAGSPALAAQWITEKMK